MVKTLLIIAGLAAASVAGYHFGQQKMELQWAQERELMLQSQISRIQEKDRELAKLQTTITTLNDTALRVRERDAQIQRKLQSELGNCSRFKSALELSSAALSRCAERAVSDRKLIEWCAIQLRR